MAAIDVYAAAAYDALLAASTALAAAKVVLVAGEGVNTNVTNIVRDAAVLYAEGTRRDELEAKVAEIPTAADARNADLAMAVTAVDDAIAAIALVGAPPE